MCGAMPECVMQERPGKAPETFWWRSVPTEGGRVS